MNWFVGDEAGSSASYFIGWMASGWVLAGDVRDTIETIYQGDALGTGLNVAALLPVFGDGEKVVKNAGKHLIKYPEKAAELGKAMVKYGAIDALPYDGVKVALLNLYWEGAATRFIKESVTSADVLKVAKSGSLEKTLNVIKHSDGTVVWLEKGTSTWGWQHIFEGHLSDITNKFGSKTEAQVQDMIYSTIKAPDRTILNTGEEIQYIKKFIDKNGQLYEFSVIVSDRTAGIGKGNVLTAYPGV